MATPKTKTMLRKAQEIARKNREYMKNNPYRCATCRHWVEKKCAQFPKIRGSGKDGALLEDGSESCWNGWEGPNGERSPDYYPPKKDIASGKILLSDSERKAILKTGKEISRRRLFGMEQGPTVPELPPDPNGVMVYVVLARRWGCNERHTYLVGVASSLERAKEMKEKTEQDRGGKYSCDILEALVDAIPEDLETLPKVVVEADQTQPEPVVAEYLCEKNYKCPHIKRGKAP